jgi:predicted MFS family arabinose efflux permease
MPGVTSGDKADGHYRDAASGTGNGKNAASEASGATLAVLTGARFTGNLGFRWVFAFIPTVAGGLGVSLAAMGAALTARDAAGLAAPTVGRRADRGHIRSVLALGLAATGVGSIVAGVSSEILLFGAGLTVLALGKVAFDTAMNTWIATAVPFAVRGRVTGLTELSWALSFLVGVPLLALLIGFGDWRWPFVVMGLANIAMVPLVLARFRDPGHRPRAARSPWRPTRDVIAFLAGLAGVWIAMQAVLVTFATWLEDDFGLDVSGLGLTALVLGFAELAGTAATVALTDRLGKRRAVRGGALAMAIPIVLLPLAGTLAVAILLLSATVFAFEFTLISALPLLGELDPAARGRLVGVGIAVFTVARAATSLPAAWLFTDTGMTGVSILAVSALAATVAVLGLVPEPTPPAASGIAA